MHLPPFLFISLLNCRGTLTGRRSKANKCRGHLSDSVTVIGVSLSMFSQEEKRKFDRLTGSYYKTLDSNLSTSSKKKEAVLNEVRGGRGRVKRGRERVKRGREKRGEGGMEGERVEEGVEER